MLENIIISSIGSIIGAIVLGFLSILFCRKPFEKHKIIYSKIKHLQRNYRDVFNKNPHDSFVVGTIEKECKEIMDIINSLHELKDTNPIFAYMFNYKHIITLLDTLFYYTKDPVMLEKDRMFEKEYQIDLKLVFKKIYLYMNFQYKVLFLLIAIFSVFFAVKSLLF